MYPWEVAHTRPRWRTAKRVDLAPRRRVMLRSGRKGTVRRVLVQDHRMLIVLVAVDGRTPGDERYLQAIPLQDLRVPNRRAS